MGHLVGMASYSGGIGLLCYLDAKSSISQWVFINLVVGIGMGILYPTVMLAVQAAADPEYLTISVTMTPFFRVIGQAVGSQLEAWSSRTAFNMSSDTTPSLAVRQLRMHEMRRA